MSVLCTNTSLVLGFTVSGHRPSAASLVQFPWRVAKWWTTRCHALLPRWTFIARFLLWFYWYSWSLGVFAYLLHAVCLTQTGRIFFSIIFQYKVFGHLSKTFLWLGWALPYITTQGTSLLSLSPVTWPHTMESCLESGSKFWGEEGDQDWRIRGNILAFIQLRKICFYWIA